MEPLSVLPARAVTTSIRAIGTNLGAMSRNRGADQIRTPVVVSQPRAVNFRLIVPVSGGTVSNVHRRRRRVRRFACKRRVNAWTGNPLVDQEIAAPAFAQPTRVSGLASALTRDSS